jgi:WD40 repeat protein
MALLKYLILMKVDLHGIDFSLYVIVSSTKRKILLRSLSGHQVNTCSLQYHPYGDFIVSGSIDSNMKVWDVRNKSCIQTYTGHTKEVPQAPDKMPFVHSFIHSF